MRGPPETMNNINGDNVDQSPPGNFQNLVRLDPSAVFNQDREGLIIAEAPSVSNDLDLIEQYGWMADFDEVDKQMAEEIYIEQCFEDMWIEEQLQPRGNTLPRRAADSQVQAMENNFDKLTVSPSNPSVTGLNPNATEFIPRSTRRQ
jgi:hypothetical protein